MSWWAFTDGNDRVFADTDRGDLARDTSEPVQEGGSRDEATPEFNELVTDKKPLAGLATRGVGGKSHPRIKGLNIFAARADTQHNILIDETISKVGTAAEREAMGRQSHGTMQYDETIEPWIQDNRQFGNQYFVARPRNVQDGARNALNPASMDRDALSRAQTLGTRNARKAWLESVNVMDLGGAVNG